ncbi:shTK domain protein, partial [Ostertagia ostertagi]
TPTPTTQPPIETTTPIVPVQETCYNEQQCCAPWASRGECGRNPTYMNLWCEASCGVCTPTTYNLNTECSDRNVRCTEWARRGECRTNPSWMAENCRQACNACVQTRLQACGGGENISLEQAHFYITYFSKSLLWTYRNKHNEIVQKNQQ